MVAKGVTYRYEYFNKGKFLGSFDVASCPTTATSIGPVTSSAADALYYEFEEIGLSRQLGYGSPTDLVDRYPQFYLTSVSPYIQDAIRYLNVTSSGRQWINGLYSNVFRAEHLPRL